MKFFTVFVLAMVLTLMGVSGSAFAGEPSWLLLDENGDSKFFLDKNSVSRVPEGMEQITARVVYTDQGKSEALKLLKPAKDYEGLVESRYVYALDCAKEKSKLLQVRHLKGDGTLLKAFDLASVTPWEEIPPNARLMIILRSVCAP